MPADAKKIAYNMIDVKFKMFPESKASIVLNTKTFDNVYLPDKAYDSQLLDHNIKSETVFKIAIRTDDLTTQNESEKTIIVGSTEVTVDKKKYLIAAKIAHPFFYILTAITNQKVKAKYNGTTQKVDCFLIMYTPYYTGTEDPTTPNVLFQPAEITFNATDFPEDRLEIDKYFNIGGTWWAIDSWAHAVNSNDVIAVQVHRSKKEARGGH